MVIAGIQCVNVLMWTARRGLVMGLWNSHTSVGNIAGSIIAGAFVEHDWALSFIIPGLIIIAMSLPVLLFLVPRTFSNRQLLVMSGFAQTCHSLFLF